MSLDLRDIERGVGADLMRRPIVSSIINACILRFYCETLGQIEESALEAEEDGEDSILRKDWFVPLVASATYIVVHIFMAIGVLETIFWVLTAIIFKLFRLPRIYAFEKLILDVKVLLSKGSVRHVEKTITFRSLDGTGLQELQASRTGFGGLVLTTITCDDIMTRDTKALFRLIRYINKPTICYWSEGFVIMAGNHTEIVDALCNIGTKAATIDLGWHKDIQEQTVFKLSAKFTKEVVPEKETSVTVISRRRIVVEIEAEEKTEDMELLVQCMDQFAAVCESGERGVRQFNGKRISIYGVGIIISVALIFRYEGFEGLVKPSADVLTLAVGAYTLWMTLGKSAALGETEEKTVLHIPTRKNLLMTYHGLADIENNVKNVCWVPDIYRSPKEVDEDREEVDGSITMLEAAICLSIFNHFGHLVKWKGRRLKLDVFRVTMGPEGIAHIESVDRVRTVNELSGISAGCIAPMLRIGYPKLIPFGPPFKPEPVQGTANQQSREDGHQGDTTGHIPTDTYIHM